MRKSKKLSVVLLLIFVMTLFGSLSASAANLSDISGHWAQSEIKAMVDKGAVTGYPDNTFKPNNTITRAEFITIVNRAFSFTETAEISYRDVKPTDWFASQIQRASAAGYIAGYEDNTMRPGNNISRQEAAVIITRILNLDTSNGAAEVDRFTDAASIPAWSKNAIGAAVKSGYLTGYPDQSFKAGNAITRAEAVVVIGRCLVAEIFNEAGTYGPQTGSETIDGNVIISASGVTLRNMVITGDLTIAASVGEGNFTLKNVTVNGTTYVNGGGANSGTLDGFFGKIVVNKDGVRLIATGGTSVSSTTLNSFARLEEPSSLTGSGFYNLVLTGSIPAGTTIVISGQFNNVIVNAPGVTVQIESGSKVASLEVNQFASITGTGTITTATINASNVTLAQTPNTTTVAEGLTTVVGDKEVSGTYTKPSTGGGGTSGPSDPVNVPVTSITLDYANRDLLQGDSFTLTATVLPAGATNKNVIWTSSRRNIADVDNTGRVTAINSDPSPVIITATTEDGHFKATCSVTVVPLVTGVSLDKANMSMLSGATAQLVPLIAPENATQTGVTWESDNDTVATVDVNGVVTAGDVGTAAVTVKTVQGGYQATCLVTVAALSKAVDSVAINQDTLTLKEGDKFNLVGIITPNDATNTNVTWSSDSPGVATVDVNTGVVTAVGKGGPATITVTAADDTNGVKSDTCVITVTRPVTGVTLNEPALPNGFAIGDATVNATATVAPATDNDTSVDWSTGDPTIALVDNTGKVTPVGVGTTAITVTTTDGGYADSWVVTVGVRATGATMNQNVISLKVGGTYTMSATVQPSNCTNKALTWASVAPGTASVNAASGLVTGVAAGSTTITATPQFKTDAATAATGTVKVYNVTGVDLEKKASVQIPGLNLVTVKFTVGAPVADQFTLAVLLNDGTQMQYQSNAGSTYTFAGATTKSLADITSATVYINNTLNFSFNF